MTARQLARPLSVLRHAVLRHAVLHHSARPHAARLHPTRTLLGTLLASTLLLGAAGCQSDKRPPLTTAAAEQPGYAIDFPADSEALRTRFSENAALTDERLSELPSLGAEWKPEEKAAAHEVYELADEAGRSGDYARRYEEQRMVATFREQEDDALTKGVAGATHYSAKQEECKDPGKVAGAAVASMDKAMSKQSEERLRKGNAAHAYLDTQSQTLGKAAEDKLRKQADELAELSFLVHVGLEEDRRAMEDRLAEVDTVKKTLEEEKEELAEAKRSSERDGKALEARRAAVGEALGRLESEKAALQRALESAQKQIEERTKRYDEGLEKLEKSVEAKD